MNFLFFKSVLKGALVGIIVIAAVPLITSPALMLVADATPMIKACALAADFAGGLGAAIAAVAFNKHRPLLTAPASGMILCAVLFALSIIFDYDGSVWLPLGCVMTGSLIAALVPAFSFKSNKSIVKKSALHSRYPSK